MFEWLYKLLEPAVLIQIVIAVGLGIYAWDTRKIRKTSQQQNEIMQRPCLVPLVTLREDSSVNQDVLKGRPYPEQKVLDPGVTDSVKLRNIGNGPALKIRYEAQIQKKGVRCGGGILPYISKDEPESINLSPYISNQWGTVKLKLSYESLSGQSYESEMSIKESDAVVTDFKFRPCPTGGTCNP